MCHGMSGPPRLTRGACRTDRCIASRSAHRDAGLHSGSLRVRCTDATAVHRPGTTVSGCQPRNRRTSATSSRASARTTAGISTSTAVTPTTTGLRRSIPTKSAPDWLANGILSALYHLHVPWVIPQTILVDTFALAYPSRRYRSALLGIATHSAQSVFFTVLVVGLVLR